MSLVTAAGTPSATTLVAILAELHTFRGASRFTTRAYKFVLLAARLARP